METVEKLIAEHVGPEILLTKKSNDAAKTMLTYGKVFRIMFFLVGAVGILASLTALLANAYP